MDQIGRIYGGLRLSSASPGSIIKPAFRQYSMACLDDEDGRETLRFMLNTHSNLNIKKGGQQTQDENGMSLGFLCVVQPPPISGMVCTHKFYVSRPTS